MSWISTHQQNFEQEQLYEFAITDKQSGQLYGAIGLSNRQQHQNGEIAYWIGEPYWGNGYGTEAASAIIEFALRKNSIIVFMRSIFFPIPPLAKSWRSVACSMRER